MKKIIKNNIFGFILGGIVFGSIVHGINTYESKSISYTPTDSSWSINNVGEALNDLYRIATLGDAKETQILSGKTAVVKGKTLTGAMVNKSAASQVGNSFSVNESGTIGEDSYTATGSIKIPVAGYYDTSSILTFDLTENNKSYYDLKLNDSEIIKKQYIFTSTDSNLFQTKDISIEDKEIVSYGIKSISLDLKGIGHNSSYKYVHAIGLKDFDGTNITGYCYAQSNYSGTIAYGTITVEVVYK